MTRFRPLLHLVLIFAVLATAQILGAARGHARVAGEIVICSGQGVVTLQVDADGNPVGPPMICPDCALTLLVENAPLQWTAAHPMRLVPGRRPTFVPVWAAPDKMPVPQARGPPVWS